MFDDKIAEYKAKLEMPLFPDDHTFTWKAFIELHSQRTSNGFGSNPISYSEIQAYCNLTDTVLIPYEVSGITICDSAFLSAQAALSKASREAKAANKETTKNAPSSRR